jgi:hypothetical protein
LYGTFWISELTYFIRALEDTQNKGDSRGT